MNDAQRCTLHSPNPTIILAEQGAENGGGQLFQLATRPRHQWGPQRHVAASDSLSHHEQFEWHCAACHLVRITVIPKGADPRREYRRAGDLEQFTSEREPWCEPVLTDMGCKP